MGKQDNHLWGIAEVGIHQIKRDFVIADDGIAGRVCGSAAPSVATETERRNSGGPAGTQANCNGKTPQREPD